MLGLIGQNSIGMSFLEMIQTIRYGPGCVAIHKYLSKLTHGCVTCKTEPAGRISVHISRIVTKLSWYITYGSSRSFFKSPLTQHLAQLATHIQSTSPTCSIFLFFLLTYLTFFREKLIKNTYLATTISIDLCLFIWWSRSRWKKH